METTNIFKLLIWFLCAMILSYIILRFNKILTNKYPTYAPYILLFSMNCFFIMIIYLINYFKKKYNIKQENIPNTPKNIIKKLIIGITFYIIGMFIACFMMTNEHYDCAKHYTIGFVVTYIVLTLATWIIINKL